MKPSRKFLSSVIFFTMSSHLLHGAADVLISGDTDQDISSGPVFRDLTNDGGESRLQNNTLASSLALSNSTVTTNTVAGSAPNGGQIILKDSLAWSSSSSLFLVADTSMVITATITSIGGGGLNINSGTSVAFATELTLQGSPANLTVISSGITQGDPSRKMSINGLADLSGGAGNVTLTSANNFGSLKLTGAAVTVNENSSTLLTGVAAGSLNLTTNGEITDSSGANIGVAGLATLNASGNAITLGDNGTDVTNFGSLNLTGTVINITEDSGTVLAGVTGATSFTLNSNGAITDTGNISVSGLATLNSNGNSITLGDAVGEVTDFGSLNFKGGAVSISEDSGMNLVGANSASSATLAANGMLTDTGATSVIITGLGRFSGSSLSLGAGSFNTGTLTFSSSGTVNITEDSDLVLVGDNTGTTTSLTAIGGGVSDFGTGTSVNVGVLTLLGNTVSLGAGTFNATTINFNSTGAVNIAENSNMDLVGVNTAASATLSSTGALSNAGASDLTITGLGSFSGTSISLTAGNFNTGSLTVNSGGAVNVQEDSATVLTGANTANILTLNSVAGITDLGATTLGVTTTANITAGGATSIVLDDTAFTVGGNTTLTAGGGQDIIVNNAANAFTGTVTFVASSGTLANVDVRDTTAFDLQPLTVTNNLTAISDGVLTDSGNLSVGSLATLGGSTINIGGSTETTNFGSLNFKSAGAVSIQEDSSTLLTGTSTGQSLVLNSTAGITNGGTASVGITNNASFTGTSITLGTIAGDMMNFGSLTFASSGAVTIQEDSSTLLSGINTANTLNLTSTDAITDSGNLSVTGLATLSGTAITIGGAGLTTNLGSLNFTSVGPVSVQEDSDTLITGTNTAGGLTLASNGAITDATGTSFIVTGGSSMTATGAITLNDTATDVLTATGNAAFTGSAITIGPVGAANFGSLTVNSTGAVGVQEDSDTMLSGTSTAGSLTLNSAGAITDAATTSMIVSGGSFMTAAGLITLNDNTNDVLTVTGTASFNGSAISIGTLGTANFGLLNVTSAGAVGVQEDSDTLLTGTNTAGGLTLTSAGAITDASGTSLVVNGASTMTAANAITLNDISNDILTVTGNASFSGSAITIGPAGTANFGSLTLNSAGAVGVQEDSDTMLSGMSTAGVLTLSSAGAITDALGTSLVVTGGSSMTATNAITLNDTASDVLTVTGNAAFNGSAITIGALGTANFGSLTVTSAGVVDVQEDSATLLTGTNSAGGLTLSSTGAITDALGTSLAVTGGSLMTATNAITLNDTATDVLTVTGNASFNGSAITIGALGTANFGSLTVNSAGAVDVQEDSDSLLTAINTAGDLTLSSTGAITDAAGTSLVVTGASTMTATNAITLNDTATDVLTVTGIASFNGSTITIGALGTANFGSLIVNSAGAVNVQEDSNTLLSGMSTAGGLTLSSSGAITDATGTSIVVTGVSSMTATNAITLNDTATDVLTVTGNASFNGSAITIGPVGAANFGSLTVTSAGAVDVQEDSNTLLTGTNTAGGLTLSSTGAITDAAGTSLVVTGASTMTATNAITLNDTASDVLTVTGNASFNGSAIIIGALGTTNFGSLTVNSAGAVNVHEDSATLLTGTNTAGGLTLSSTGAITDATGTSLVVTGASTMTATNAITLNDTASDVLTVTGNAAFNGSAITIGALGTTNFGSLTFNSAGAVNVQEDSATLLTGTNTAGGLILSSTGAITDATGTSLVVTGVSSMTATNAITLNDTASDVLTVTGNASFSGSAITIGALGTANFGALTVNSAGAVNVQEDSATLLTGTNTAGGLILSSTGAITDATGTSLVVTGVSSMTATNAITLNDTASDVLTVTGNASFSGSAITIGALGTANFGALTVNSAGAVDVQEDSATLLTGTNTAGGLTLSSTGAITDATGTSLVVTGASTMTATNAITLNDTATDVLTMTGNASFNGSAITIGALGTANFGSLTVNSAGAVDVQEDSATLFTGTNTAGGLTLSSTGAITDAAGTSLVVTGASTMMATNAITLNDTATDVLTVTGNASFKGLSIMLGSLGTANFDSLTFNSIGTVTIQEDSASALSGINTANSLSLTSSGAITDNLGTSLIVTGDSSMTATNAITLNNSSGDILDIGGNAAFSGSAISLGSAGLANFDSLTFNSLGSVTIQEDSATVLSGINTANSLSLTSAGSIADNASTSLTVTGGLSMTATLAITLNDSLGDILSIGSNAAFSGSAITIGSLGIANFGSLTFNSTGNVSIHEDSSMQILGVNTGGNTILNSTGGISDAGAISINTSDLTVSGSSINLGSGTFNAATVNFNSGGQVTIAEDSGMNLVGVNTANSATLSSTESISDAANSSLTISELTTLTGASIDLGVGANNTFNTGTLKFNSAGAVTIEENSDMDIVGVNTAASVTLTSGGALSDEAATSINITGRGEFRGTSIDLGGGLFNAGALIFNSDGAVTIHEDSSTSLSGSNTASSLFLNSTAGITNEAITSLSVLNHANLAGASITLGTVGGDTIHFGTLAFNSAGAVTIVEDSSTMLSGTSTAGSLALTSGGALTDSGNLTVTDLASLRGTSIMIGGAGNSTHFGSLTVNSPGAVEVQEDSDTQFIGTNTASTLTLRSSGISTFAAGSSLDAMTLDVKTQSVVLTGNNLVDTIEVKLSDETALKVNGAETIRKFTSDGGTLEGSAILTVTDGATLNGSSVVSGKLFGNTTSTGNVLLSGMMGGGDLMVTGGTLTLTGTATANTTVSKGATLKGAGFIVGDLTNYGTTALSLTISGSLVTKGFVAMSFNNSLDFDKIKAASADLDGGLIVTNTGTGLANGEKAKIIDAGSYTGAFTAFSSVDFDNGLLFDDKTGILIGLAGGVSHSGGRYLNLTENQTNTYLGLFENAVETGVKNVARSGDVITFTSGASNGEDQLVTALNESTFGTPGVIDINIVNGLSPEVFAGMADYTEQALRTHVRQVFDTAPSVRKGKTEVFATLHFSTAGVDDSTNNAAYDIEFAGVTTGIRYDVDQNFKVGGLLGVDNGSITGTLIDADGQGLVLGGFGSYQFKDKFQTMVLGSLTYGNYSYDTTRQSYGGETSADGIKSGAIELTLGVGTVVYEKNNLRISPTGGFRLMSGSVDSIKEEGAGVPLVVDEQDIESFLLEVGVDFSYQVLERFSVVGRLGYIQNLSDTDQDVTATFAKSGPGADSFTVTAPGIDTQGVTVGVGLYYDMTESARMGLMLNSEFGSDSLPSQTFGLGLTYGF